MWIKSVEIHDFRAFQEGFKIELSKNITCISGHNEIGIYVDSTLVEYEEIRNVEFYQGELKWFDLS